MERKITHYVVKPEHQRHLCRLLCLINPEEGELGRIDVTNDASLIRILTEAKVLDLWCTPVYEKEKVTGWYIVLVSGNMVGPFTSKDAANSLPDDRPSKGVTFIDQEIE